MNLGGVDVYFDNISSCFIHDIDNAFNSIFHRKIQNLINENPEQFWYIGSCYNYFPYHIINRDKSYKSSSRINIKINKEKLGLYLSGGIFYSLSNFLLSFKWFTLWNFISWKWKRYFKL